MKIMAIDLHQKATVVTGATSGIGLAVARQFAEAGAFVIGVGRSVERNKKAIESILAESPQANVTYILADLSSQAEVRQLAIDIKEILTLKGFDQLDVLINNAGVYMEKMVLTEDRIETTFAVNHLAGFLLTYELLDWIRRADGRVLTTSSYSHRTTPLCLNRIAYPWPHIGLMAYKRSKLCNVLFTYELNRRYSDLTAFAVDPGLVNTAIASKSSKGIADWVWRRRRNAGTSSDVPARTYVFLTKEKEIDTSHGYYFKDCKPIASSRKSQDPMLAEKLWELSTRLVGVD
jgi:NAD(P)-dependent dehydrogenase (short-subunit alcohol dehydrogenase family)